MSWAEIKKAVNSDLSGGIKYQSEGTLDNVIMSLPYDFYYGCAVVYRGEIHILGGEASNCRKAHYKWDGYKWSKVSTLPYDFYNGHAVVYNDKIHILSSDSSTNNGLLHYTWDGSKWLFVSALPYDAYDAKAAVWGDSIYLLGGNPSNRKSFYKFKDESWTSLGQLPYEFANGIVIGLGDKLHVMGGNINGIRQSDHYTWNGSSWSFVGSLASQYTFQFCSSVVYNGRIHVIGYGEGGTGHAYFDGVGTWNSITNIPRSSRGGVYNAVVFANCILVLGDYNSPRNYSIWDNIQYKNYIPTLTLYLPKKTLIYFDPNKTSVLGVTASIQKYGDYCEVLSSGTISISGDLQYTLRN